ncbi:MAG: hypothetical protein ACM3X7_11700 [Solirubrobacterales bacterium]
MKLKIIIPIIVLVIILVEALIVVSKPPNATDSNKGLSSEEKHLLKYSYEIPDNLNVLDIISDNKLVIQESNEIKIYSIAENKSSDKLADISEGFKVTKVITFDEGIIWVENRTTPDITSRIYVKYFSSNKVNLLDESKSDILPSIALSPSSRYLSYYIINGNKVDVKYYDLDKNVQKSLAQYELNNENGLNLVSTPNSDDNAIVWSYSTNKESSLFKYSITTGQIEKLSNADMTQPVITNNKIVALKRYDFYDNNKKITYASDYILQYNYDTKQWVKFEEGKINDYMDGNEESIITLSFNNGLFYWMSTLSNGKCVYDFTTYKFIPLTEKDAKNTLQTSIKIVKGKLVYYEARDYNNNYSNFLYIVK